MNLVDMSTRDWKLLGLAKTSLGNLFALYEAKGTCDNTVYDFATFETLFKELPIESSRHTSLTSLLSALAKYDPEVKIVLFTSPEDTQCK